MLVARAWNASHLAQSSTLQFNYLSYRVTQTTARGRKSRLRRLKTAILKSSDFAPLLFNVYNHDLSTISSRLYAYVDDFANINLM